MLHIIFWGGGTKNTKDVVWIVLKFCNFLTSFLHFCRNTVAYLSIYLTDRIVTTIKSWMCAILYKLYQKTVLEYLLKLSITDYYFSTKVYFPLLPKSESRKETLSTLRFYNWKCTKKNLQFPIPSTSIRQRY